MLSFDVRLVLRDFALDVDLDVHGCLAIAGPSGAGKSTILRVCAGLVRPDRGRVVCGGDVWLDTDEGVCAEPDERACGLVFQDYALFPHMPAWRNVAYGMRGLARRDRRPAADELLARFDVAHLADAHPRSLSGGERQRVALARALATSPQVLLLDEPLAALDTRTRAAAARELASTIRGAGVPTLLVTHDFADAALLGDEVAVVDRGRVLQRGPAAELAAAPASSFVADFAGASVLSGDARPAAEGLTALRLDGGGEIFSTDPASGRAAASVFPWDVTVEAPGAPVHGSAQNTISATVTAVTPVGNRVRLALSVPQPLIAEITQGSVQRLGLAPGARVEARWKATATRLVPL